MNYDVTHMWATTTNSFLVAHAGYCLAMQLTLPSKEVVIQAGDSRSSALHAKQVFTFFLFCYNFLFLLVVAELGSKC